MKMARSRSSLISVAGRKRSCKDGAFDAPGKTGTCGGETMNGKNTDYEKYQYSVKEIIRYVSECVILCLVVDYLFYKNIWMLLLAVPLPVLYLKLEKETADPGEKAPVELPVPGCLKFYERGSAGRLFGRKCGFCMCSGSGAVI